MARDLPVFDDLRVASPCSASWEAMKGDDQARFCAQCQLHVYNLSAMTRAEAEALVGSREGQFCVRFYRRRDGTGLTRDCPVGHAAARRWLVAQISGVTGAFGLLSSVLAIGRAAPVKQALQAFPWRQREPFRTVWEWLDPTPPAPVMGMVVAPVSPPPKPTPVSTRKKRG